jgi:adenylate cyclase
LVEAETGHHIWADRFEGSLEDIFELQGRVTESVVGAIEPTLRRAEIERARSAPTANLHAYDLCLRAMSLAYVPTRKMESDEAIRLLKQAIAMDPEYSYAKAFCAFTYTIRRGQHWDEDGEISEGLRLADEALQHHRDDPATLACAAHSLSLLGRRHKEALHAIDRALALNPNSTRVALASGWIRNYIGLDAEAIEHF